MNQFLLFPCRRLFRQLRLSAGILVLMELHALAGQFHVTVLPDRLRIAYDHQPIGDYVFRDEKILRPYFCNLKAPDGTDVTRRHPPRPGLDATDHDTMHPGLWLAFGALSGDDFWRNKGDMKHVRFLRDPQEIDGRLSFTTLSELRSHDDQLLGRVTTDIGLVKRPAGWLVVWEVTLQSDDREISLGDQEEMGFGARMATDLTEKSGASIVNSRGQRSAATTWGRTAAWCDYAKTIDGQSVGITLMTAPTNFRPSWWHNRDYGLIVSNPFGRQALTRGAASQVVVKPGRSLRLAFAALLHAAPGYDPAEAYRDALGYFESEALEPFATQASPSSDGFKSQPDMVIYRGNYPGWPWIDRTPAGKLVAVWREGTVHDYSPDGRLQLSTSDEGGRSWSAATTILDEPKIDDRNVALTCLSDMEWLVCYNSYTADRISRVWTFHTTDGGTTWSQPSLVSELDARTRSAPVQLSSGELVLPFYRAPGDQSMAAISKDNGQSWTIVGIENGAGFVGDEWDLTELADGRLIGIIRNSAPGLGPDEQGWFYVVESHDQGRTWTKAKRTNLRDTRSTSPAQIFLHAGQPTVLFSNARMVSVVMATTDDPQLVTWKTDQLLPCYRYRADGMPITDGSYPVSVALPHNQRLIVDYVHDGETHAIVGHVVTMPQPSAID